MKETNDNLQRLCDWVKIEIFTLHLTHFEYVLKYLKRKSPEILNHPSNSPIIIIDNVRYITNLVQLVALFIIELKMPREIFVRSMYYTFD